MIKKSLYLSDYYLKRVKKWQKKTKKSKIRKI